MQEIPWRYINVHLDSFTVIVMDRRVSSSAGIGGEEGRSSLILLSLCRITAEVELRCSSWLSELFGKWLGDGHRMPGY